MTSENSSVPSRSRDDKKSTALEHDVAETIYAGTDHVARCPECGRETLWCDREHLPHRETCPYWEVDRQ
jgi:hypothetical protein